MEANEQLLDAVRGRLDGAGKQSPFGYGILTADRYVANLQDCVGLPDCYRYAKTRTASFGDAMRKARQTLVYSNPDMDLLEVFDGTKAPAGAPDGVEWPKNMLMSFVHILTTPRKDRDGDVLRTEGAIVDPKMLLLWQHVHTLPIGKMVYVVEHNAKRLVLCSAIVDTNPLAHDAAVMVDNDMARFSHGFRALEFSQLKESPADPTGAAGGFDVKRFEIMEESIVSVPSNADAEVVDKVVTLVEGGKLRSPLLKAMGRRLRESLPLTVAGVAMPGAMAKGADNEDDTAGAAVEDGTGDKASGDCGCGGCEGHCTCGAPEEADGHAEKAEDQAAEDPQGLGWDVRDNEIRISGNAVTAAADDAAKDRASDGPQDKPGALESQKGDDMTTTAATDGDSKAGRTISQATAAVLKDCLDDMDELKNQHCTTRAAGALCERCSGRIKGLLSMGVTPEDDDNPEPVTSTQPAAKSPADIIAAAMRLGPADRDLLLGVLTGIRQAEETNQKGAILKGILG